jgi:hypothetical protein
MDVTIDELPPGMLTSMLTDIDATIESADLSNGHIFGIEEAVIRHINAIEVWLNSFRGAQM